MEKIAEFETSTFEDCKKEPNSFEQDRFSWNRSLLFFSFSEATIHKSVVALQRCYLP